MPITTVGCATIFMLYPHQGECRLTTLAVVSPTEHADKTWRRFTSYRHAADAMVVPLVSTELILAAAALPVGFVPTADGYEPIALLGVETGHNLFVHPDGQWLGRYVPAALRSYPFQVAARADGEKMLCVDEDSGLLRDDASGEAFFTDEGELAPALREVFDFLHHLEVERQITAIACGLLQDHGLLEPWPITLKDGDDQRPLEGLWRISEPQLKAIDGAVLQLLRDGNALPMVYCQLLSMQHLGLLADLALVHAKVRPVVPKASPFGSGEVEFRFDH